MPTYEEQLKKEPHPTCCEKARFLIFFTIDSVNVWDGPGWYIESMDSRMLPEDLRMVNKGAYKVSCCPLCGTDLPEIRLREKPPEPMCEIDGGHLYCLTCNKRLMECQCYKPEALYEAVREN